MNSRENSFDKKSSGKAIQGKTKYREPVLQFFGSVRELTKGSLTAGSDGGASKARNR